MPSEEELDKTIETVRIRQTVAMQKFNERQLNDFTEGNNDYSKTKYLVVPLNLLLLYGTFKYPQYFTAYTKRFMEQGGRPSLRNLFLISTIQAIGFSTIIISTNCLVFGVNPLGVIRRFRRQWGAQADDAMKDMVVSDSSVIPGLPPGTKYQDLPKELQSLMFEQSMATVILLDLGKTLGLTDKTILIIEQDLRNMRLAE